MKMRVLAVKVHARSPFPKWDEQQIERPHMFWSAKLSRLLQGWKTYLTDVRHIPGFWWCWYFVFFVGNPTYLKSTFGQSIHGQPISTIQKYHQDLDPQILLAFVKVLWDLTRTIFLSYSQLIEIWEIFDLLSVGFWIEIATLRKNANTATRIILFWMSKPLCYRMPGSFKFAWSRKSW